MERLAGSQGERVSLFWTLLLRHEARATEARLKSHDLAGAREIGLGAARGALRLLRSSTAEEVAIGRLVAFRASLMLTAYANAVKDTALSRRMRSVQINTDFASERSYLPRLWAIAGDVNDPALVFEALGSQGLGPSDRWNMVGFIVDGFCSSAREIGGGVSPTRLALLDSATQRLQDIPRSGEWVAAHRARLARLIQSPAEMEMPVERVRFATWLLKPVAWMGLHGMYARMTYCLAWGDRTW